jgi:hypothetical protein
LFFPFQAFNNTGSAYRNYKNSFSIVLLGAADAEYRFVYVDIGTEGGSNDAGIYNRSTLKAALEAGHLHFPEVDRDDPLQVPFHFLGDDAFSLNETMMKPFPNKSLDPKERVFNFRFSRGRRVIENTFGIMSSRFRVLRVPIAQKYGNAVLTVEAVVALHNFLIDQQCPSECEVDRARQEQPPGAHRPGVPGQGTAPGRVYRERMSEFFFDEGQVPFQWERTFGTGAGNQAPR